MFTENLPLELEYLEKKMKWITRYWQIIVGVWVIHAVVLLMGFSGYFIHAMLLLVQIGCAAAVSDDYKTIAASNVWFGNRKVPKTWNLEFPDGVAFIFTGASQLNNIRADYLEAVKYNKELTKKRRPNVLIIGHKDHGKDTVAEYLYKYTGLTFRSSSEFACEHIVWPEYIKGESEYTDWRELHRNRDKFREFFFDVMKAYNTPRGERLTEEILAVADVYVGMRGRHEYDAAMKKKYYDLVIWVDASERKPLESARSMELTEKDAHLTIRNNGTEKELEATVAMLARLGFPDRISPATPNMYF